MYSPDEQEKNEEEPTANSSDINSFYGVLCVGHIQLQKSEVMNKYYKCAVTTNGLQLCHE